MMPDYAFYVEQYLGELIPSQKFAACAARAGEALDYFRRTFTVSGGEVEQMLALCAMAETVYRTGRREGLVSATAGSVSVRYQEQGDRQLWRELFEKAKIYLDICRGVAG